jgi:AAA15 family ATPase/GTPase
MLRTLIIENFRCFQAFELQQLGKLNLLVGTNNSGKTSILEAVQLLNSQSSLESLREVMIGRGEYIFNDERTVSRELDVRHLFYGHEIDVGSKFSILGNNHNNGEGVTVSVEHTEKVSLFEDLREFVLVIQWLGQENENVKLPLSSKSGLPLDYVRRVRRDLKNSVARTQFVTSSASCHRR